MAKAILADDHDRIEYLIGRYIDTFGDNFYMELHTWQFMNPTTEEQIQLNADMSFVNQAKVEIAKKYGDSTLIVVNDSHYAYIPRIRMGRARPTLAYLDQQG